MRVKILVHGNKQELLIGVELTTDRLSQTS